LGEIHSHLHILPNGFSGMNSVHVSLDNPTGLAMVLLFPSLVLTCLDSSTKLNGKACIGIAARIFCVFLAMSRGTLFSFLLLSLGLTYGLKMRTDRMSESINQDSRSLCLKSILLVKGIIMPIGMKVQFIRNYSRRQSLVYSVVQRWLSVLFLVHTFWLMWSFTKSIYSKHNLEI
jgi:uncharacterized membrane protein YGL010W